MLDPSTIRNFAASAMVLVLAGCLMLPARGGGGEAGGYDLEKELAFNRASVINTLDGVLVKQGFRVAWKDPEKGMLSAQKTGFLFSDYGHSRFQKFCLFWGYASYGTLLLEARADSEGPLKTRLKFNTTPKSPGILHKTMEELELKLLLGEKPE